MAYRYGNRDQYTLLPNSVDDYVPEDAPVRAYDAMIEAMDLTALGFLIDEHRVGNSQYDPKAMLKLLVYGYSYGIRSSRKLERECHYNLSFIWLVGGLKPDHKTIAEFRRNNKTSLHKVIHQCARICIDLKLIEGNVLFIDGTRLRANAAVAKSMTVSKCKEALSELDDRIERLLKACESTDAGEAQQASLVHLEKSISDNKKLKSRIQEVMERLKAEDRHSLNTTDEDCVRIHSRQGSHAGYNGQIVVDDANGLIVNSDVVAENNDCRQFIPQLRQTSEVLDKPCKTACADAGYTNYSQLKQMEDGKTDIIVPPVRPTIGLAQSPFDKSHFKYDPENDCFICPEGNKLTLGGIDTKERCRSYYGKEQCIDCKHFGKCTTNRKHGRKVRRYEYEDFRNELESRYCEPDARAIFTRRKMRVEHPFGHLKRNLGAGHFILRGLAGVRAEMSILASCFNICRLITMIGVVELTSRLKEYAMV